MMTPLVAKTMLSALGDCRHVLTRSQAIPIRSAEYKTIRKVVEEIDELAGA
jgi:hypothetical protein